MNLLLLISFPPASLNELLKKQTKKTNKKATAWHLFQSDLVFAYALVSVMSTSYC